MRNTKWLMLSFSFVLAVITFTSCEKEYQKEKTSDNLYNKETKMEGGFMGVIGEDTEIEFLGQKYIVKDVGNYYILQGDIRLNKNEIDSISKLQKLKSSAVNNRKWQNSKVYYRIEGGFPNSQRVTDAINHIQSSTNVIFEYNSYASDYIEIVYDESITSSDWIGKKGGRQVIGIADWATTGNVIHEICHALGLFHEQSRADRDNNIIVNLNNIDPDWQSQYKKYSESGYSGFDFNLFDFGSIMLYSSDNSYNGNWSMTRLNGNPFFGQRISLSNDDINILNYLYENIPISLHGNNDVTFFKSWDTFTYYVDFGSSDPGSCSWSVSYSTGGGDALAGGGSSIILVPQYLSSIKNGINEVNYLKVFCSAANQEVTIPINVKDGYRLYNSGGGGPEF